MSSSELESFQRWLRQLSHDDLLRAMEFHVEENEFVLLKEMIQLQTPPPTPIHPGILGFRQATVLGATDGRNPEEYVHKARFSHPRMFQFMETSTFSTPVLLRNGKSRRGRSSTNNNAPKKYDVIARKKVTPWGDVLSIGCTQEQRDYDEYILRGTRIHHGAGVTKCAFCSSTSDDDILRMLQVASRGKFASMLHSMSTTNPPFCAPWMNSTMEWFSLPMFLASRFEVALCASFRNYQTTRTIPLSWLDSCRNAVEKLNATAFQDELLSATVKALAKNVLVEDSTLKMIRDSVIWGLLERNESVILRKQNDDAIDLLTEIGSVAIVDFGTSRQQFMTALWSQLQEMIAAESEREMLASLEKDTQAASITNNNTLSKRRKGKNKKKKRNRVRETKSRNEDSKEEESVILQPRFASPRQRHDDMIDLQMPLMDPQSIENAKENTKRFIMAASIVNDVLENVFDQLGLNYPSDEETVDDVTMTTDGRKATDDAAGSRKARDEQPKPSNGHIERSTVIDGEKKIVAKASPAPPPMQLPIGDEAAFPGLPTHLASNDETLRLSNQSKQEFHLGSDFFSVPWMFDETVDGWEKLKRYPNREKSLLADLFLSQKRDGEGDKNIASSTAASIASSSDKESDSEDNDSVSLDDQKDKGREDGEQSAPTTPIAPAALEEAVLEAVAASINESAVNDVPLTTLVTNEESSDVDNESHDADEDGDGQDIDADERREGEEKELFNECRSPSPPAPKTPPPQLSPILVSLADLQTIRARAATEAVDSPKALSFSALTAESLPSSPLPASSATLTPSWSRDDLRINAFTDDHRLNTRSKGFTLKKRTSAPLSYRNVAAKALPKVRSSTGSDGKPPFVEVAQSDTRSSVRSAMSIPDFRRSGSSRNDGSDTCARSETAADALSYEIPLNDAPRLSTRDNTEVTISTKTDSGDSPDRRHDVAEELASLRDERNAFRDMCLTLGAEVAKLKNQLAAQSGSSSFVDPVTAANSQFGPESPYGTEFAPPYFQGVPKATTTVGAMSDAGTHRDHDSAFSEDGTDGFGHDASGRPNAVHVRRMSSNATLVPSELSVDQNVTGQAMLGQSCFRSLSKDVIGSISGHGMQTRLTTDILNFLRAKNAALRLLDKKKTMAIERLTRLVTALWPRAQVKIYGSHMTGLCLPSSDLDFVVCLPAVHKNAPAVAPGPLEGRNAINESSQKTLARMLKGESWIDPRSIKIISRTIVPIIKVSTKDTRARTIHLDISFDAPDHHGVAANHMITEVMQELPMIQPLVLVLKQFLQDRSLLTAYTGGLSSYGLFLMVARYLQEHPSSWGDCGSLLMGFLDFYGNAFDPRTTGISVRRRQYFPRMNYSQPQPAMWDVNGFPQPQHITPSPSSSVGGHPNLIRRNSFNENATMDGFRFTVSGASSHRPPLFQPSAHHRASPQQYKHPSEEGVQPNFDQARRPYTFDPLFIEDPLHEGNNVGRNAFRIFQVQRAFSDAHRALVASLEWDIHSSQEVHDGGDYPLLNCLLQSEDVFYELDEM